jgi:predicted RNA-binding Zn ribbon-like protein
MRLNKIISEAATHKLIGGQLCLDFANTINGHDRTTPHEYLIGYPDLVVWSRRAGLFTDTEAERLLRLADEDSRKAILAYKRAIELRETIFRVFSALALSRSPKATDITALNEARWEALNRSTISSRDGGYAVDWTDKSALDRMLWPIALSAAELLTSPHLTRVRECAGDRCDWLFVDTSRNHLRRWCSMAECGNRSKSQRFLARKRKRRTP